MADPDVADAFVEQVPVERGPELLAVVGLDLVDGEGQFGQYVVDEGVGCWLVVARVGPQHAEPRAVVDRRVLVVALLAALLTEWLDELHVDLQLVAGALFLVALPPGFAALVALRAGASVHAGAVQDPPDTEGLILIWWYRCKYIEILLGPKW